MFAKIVSRVRTRIVEVLNDSIWRLYFIGCVLAKGVCFFVAVIFFVLLNDSWQVACVCSCCRLFLFKNKKTARRWR